MRDADLKQESIFTFLMLQPRIPKDRRKEAVV